MLFFNIYILFFNEQSLLKEGRLTTFNLFAVLLNKHLKGKLAQKRAGFLCVCLVFSEFALVRSCCWPVFIYIYVPFAALKTIGNDFVFGVIQAVDGEKVCTKHFFRFSELSEEIEVNLRRKEREL